LTIAQVAAASVREFVADDQVTMTAIAGSESSFNAKAKGDRLDAFSPADQELYRPFAVDGFLSFGPWQVFLGVHTPLIRQLSKLFEQGDLAAWLMDYNNCAIAAREILSSQGFTAWTMYKNGDYRRYVIEADAAVKAARAALPSPQPLPYIAFSVTGSTVHLDKADGSFDELQLTDVKYYQPWLRFEFGK